MNFPLDVENIIFTYHNPYKEIHKNMLRELASSYTLGECYGFNVLIENYIWRWRKTECLVKRHRIVFAKPFGIVGICRDCDKHIECFNYYD